MKTNILKILIFLLPLCYLYLSCNNKLNRQSVITYVNDGSQLLKRPNGKNIHIVYSASGVWTPFYCIGLLTVKSDADLPKPSEAKTNRD